MLIAPTPSPEPVTVVVIESFLTSVCPAVDSESRQPPVLQVAFELEFVAPTYEVGVGEERVAVGALIGHVLGDLEGRPGRGRDGHARSVDDELRSRRLACIELAQIAQRAEPVRR